MTEIPPRADIPEVIDCVDCGGRCHLLGYHGGLATYRCEDCRDRWDVLMHDEVPDGE